MSSTRRSFLQQISFGSAGLWVSGSLAETARSLQLPRSTPSSQGVSADGILAFLQAAEDMDYELHSLMILRHGHVIAEGWWEPYGPDYIHTMYSMSKSFTSTAIGLAVAEGKLSIEDKVVSFFPNDLPETVSDHLAALQVKDLLTMSVGHEKEPTQAVVKSENWVRTFLAQKLAHPPGSVFMYNSAATYMCSAIVQKVTGQTMLDYLTPRLFEPLGITGMKWESCPRGINTGGWGLSIQTEGMAKFGQLYLQKGMWQGRQLLPAAWVEEATAFHIQQPGDDKPERPKAQNDWLQGYGYQFWRCQHGHYRGDGAFGQFTIVLPEHDAVVVMTSENKNMPGQLDLVWQHLLPAFRESTPAVDETLASRLRTLQIPPAGGPNGKRDKSGAYALESNPLGLTEAAFDFQDSSCRVTFKIGDQAQTVTCGLGSWLRGEAAIPGTPPRLISGGQPKAGTPSRIAASAAWTDDRTLAMTWRYYETPHHDLVTCHFDGEAVKISFLSSITAMNPKAKDARAPLVGRRV